MYDLTTQCFQVPNGDICNKLQSPLHKILFTMANGYCIVLYYTTVIVIIIDQLLTAIKRPMILTVSKLCGTVCTGIGCHGMDLFHTSSP